MRRFISIFKRKPLLLVAGLVAVVGLAGLGVNHAMAGTTYTPDCSVNSMIKCGAGTPASFISKLKNNNDGHGHHDLQAVYSYFGLKPSDYDNFAKHAEEGTFHYSTGTLTVDGQVVGTNVWGVGRTADTMGGAKRTPFKIKGKTYYKSPAKGRAYKGTLSGMVYFNSKGEVQFAAEHACGNPMPVTPVKPTYSCNLLQKKSLGNNTYSFTTKASAAHNAKISKVVYSFGDGSKSVTTTSLSTPVKHQYTKYGTFTAKVTVYVHLPGNQTVTVTSAKCATKITHKKPTPPPVIKQGSASCTQLQVFNGRVDRQYSFTAYGQENLAKLTGGSFNFGDGASANGTIVPGKVAVSSAHHTYAKDGTYTITAQLHFDVYTTSNGKVTKTTPVTVKCSTKLTIKTPPKECKPGVPVGSPKCKTSTMECVSLAWGTPGTPDAYGNTEETLIATASAKNATINSYTFDFGDSHNQTVTTGDTTATVKHTYAPGQYTATVTVSMTDAYGNHTVSSSNCSVPLTVQAPKCVPNSKKPECVPCQYNSNLPSNSPECKPPVTPTPPSLPNTGPGSMIGLFAGSSLVAGLGYQVIQRRRLFSRA